MRSRCCSIGTCLVGAWVALGFAGQAPCASAPAAQPAAAFQDRTAALGLTLHPDSACCVDIDNDGCVDLIASGAVWKNNAGTGFTKIAEIGPCVAADFDNDGFVDLFCWSPVNNG